MAVCPSCGRDHIQEEDDRNDIATELAMRLLARVEVGEDLKPGALLPYVDPFAEALRQAAEEQRFLIYQSVEHIWRAIGRALPVQFALPKLMPERIGKQVMNAMGSYHVWKNFGAFLAKMGTIPNAMSRFADFDINPLTEDEEQLGKMVTAAMNENDPQVALDPDRMPEELKQIFLLLQSDEEDPP